jgi:hypothetical protein
MQNMAKSKKTAKDKAKTKGVKENTKTLARKVEAAAAAQKHKRKASESD